MGVLALPRVRAAGRHLGGVRRAAVRHAHRCALPPPPPAPQADIWASGVLLCVMLIGRFPFEGTEMSNATNLDEVSAHVSSCQAAALSAGGGGGGGILAPCRGFLGRLLVGSLQCHQASRARLPAGSGVQQGLA